MSPSHGSVDSVDEAVEACELEELLYIVDGLLFQLRASRYGSGSEMAGVWLRVRWLAANSGESRSPLPPAEADGRWYCCDGAHFFATKREQNG